MKRATIAREGSVAGTGLHTGERCVLVLKPAAAGTGLRFFRDGARLERGQAASRCTAVTDGKTELKTVEHVLSALWGMGVTDCEIHADGPEAPGLDGSAKPYADLVLSLGVQATGGEVEAWRLEEPVFCHAGKAAIAAFPSDDFSLAYTLDYAEPAIGRQSVEFTVTPDVYEREIAPARTFCTSDEAAAARSTGLGKGADETNTVVLGGGRKPALRFPDECARHKVLDLVGDLALAGFPLKARVVGIRSGHALNAALVEELRRRRNASTH